MASAKSPSLVPSDAEAKVEQPEAAGFFITPQQLSVLHVPGKDAEALKALTDLGGVAGLASGLNTDLRRGISAAGQDTRKETFGPNVFPEPPFNGIFKLFIMSFNDPVLAILIVAAVISMIVGALEDGDEGWIDGIAILMAVLIVAAVTAINDYKKELRFRSLRMDSEAMVRVRAIRDGSDVAHAVADVVVGDVLHLETGDKLVADGVFIAGNSFKTDEAAITGESDTVSKNAVTKPFLLSGTSVAAGNCTMLVTSVGLRSMQGSIMADTAMETKETPLQSKLGIMVTQIGIVGIAFAVLTLAAMLVSWALNKEALQGRTETLDFAGNPTGDVQYDYRRFTDWLIHSIITAVTVVVVAVPEGLPLAVTVSLAYSTRRMLKDNNLIRVLAACETMGNATDICSDKTGTLTENRMTVVQAWLAGAKVTFQNSSSQHKGTPSMSSNYQAVPDASLASMMKDHLAVNSTASVTWDDKGLPTVRGSKTEGAGVMLVESFGFRHRELRGTGLEAGTTPAGPLVTMASVDDIHEEEGAGGSVRDFSHRQLSGAEWTSGAVAMVRQFPFTADRKMMSTLVSLSGDATRGPFRLYVTGASEIVLKNCSKLLLPGMAVEPVTEAATREQTAAIVEMAEQALRTLGMAYRDFASLDDLPADWEVSGNEALMESDLTFTGVLGIKDPLRPDVKRAIATCHAAGIMVRMVTGDNIITARAIARECGILRSDEDVALEGPAFRAMSPAQVDAILPRLKVLARSSPRDKNMLVRRLNGALPKNEAEWNKEHNAAGLVWGSTTTTSASSSSSTSTSAAAAAGGASGRPSQGGGMRSPSPTHHATSSGEVALVQDVTLPGYLSEWTAARTVDGVVRKAIVGVTGDGTNDAPALKAADVGLSMGMSGTQVAKDASDIVILDDRFSSIVSAVMWGRSVFDNIRKFLQFQLTVNVVALMLTFIAAVSQNEPPLSPVQLLWVNLIMDTMGALALGTEVPTPALLDRKPYTRSSSIISRPMWRNILVQSAFQLAVTLFLLYSGEDAFGIDLDYVNDAGKGDVEDPVETYRNTFIFNTFVWCQVFNEFNARSIGDVVNVFQGLHKNAIFMTIIAITGVLQALIVEFGGDFTSTTGLTAEHWMWSIVIGAVALPVGVLMRYIPVSETESSFASYWQIGDKAAPETSIAVAPLERRVSPAVA